ncbi:MAG: HXXEE domain-containing protein [Candidatus Cryptobacteroides sp.]
MSGLSILLLVLPLPIVFIVHDLEEIFLLSKWMLRNKDGVAARFPKTAPLLDRLAGLGTRGFAIAAAEELLVLFLVTAYVLAQCPYAREIWTAIFLAFSIHLLVHVVQAVLVCGYVPGLVTSILLLPYAGYGIYSIHLVMNWLQILLLGLAGSLFMILNLRFAHRVGIRHV